MRGALGGLYDKLEALKQGAEGPRRQQISRLVRPQQRAIDAAFDRLRDAAPGRGPAPPRKKVALKLS